jgi:hypothetical protein
MMPNGAANFRSTIIKLYKRDLDNDKNSPSNINLPANIIPPIDTADNPKYNDEMDDFLPRFQPPPIKQGRGRPKGLKNRPKTTPTFIISKEKVDIELAHQLRTAGKITTPGKLFEASDKT